MPFKTTDCPSMMTLSGPASAFGFLFTTIITESDALHSLLATVRVYKVVCLGRAMGLGIFGLEISEAGLHWYDIILLPVLFSCCLLYTSPSPRDRTRSRMPSS